MWFMTWTNAQLDFDVRHMITLPPGRKSGRPAWAINVTTQDVCIADFAGWGQLVPTKNLRRAACGDKLSPPRFLVPMHSQLSKNPVGPTCRPARTRGSAS